MSVRVHLWMGDVVCCVYMVRICLRYQRQQKQQQQQRALALWRLLFYFVVLIITDAHRIADDGDGVHIVSTAVRARGTQHTRAHTNYYTYEYYILHKCATCVRVYRVKP